MEKHTYKIGKRGIRIDDEQALAEAFDAVNGRATEWALDAANAIRRAAEAEERLERNGVAKARRVGCTAKVEGSGPSSKSYKWAVKTTDYTLRRFGDGWRLTSVERAEVYPEYVGGMTVSIPAVDADRLRKQAVAEAMAGFAVRQEPQPQPSKPREAANSDVIQRLPAAA